MRSTPGADLVIGGRHFVMVEIPLGDDDVTAVRRQYPDLECEYLDGPWTLARVLFNRGCTLAAVFEEGHPETPVALYGPDNELQSPCTANASDPEMCSACVSGGGGMACSSLCEAGACRSCVASGGGEACLPRCSEGSAGAGSCTACVAGGGGTACASLCEEGACRGCVSSGGGAACLSRCGGAI